MRVLSETEQEGHERPQQEEQDRPRAQRDELELGRLEELKGEADEGAQRYEAVLGRAAAVERGAAPQVEGRRRRAQEANRCLRCPCI